MAPAPSDWDFAAKESAIDRGVDMLAGLKKDGGVKGIEKMLRDELELVEEKLRDVRLLRLMR